MRTIGLLGGMSWESTVTYYTELNRGARARLGGLHSAPCLMISVDFAVVERMQERRAWDEPAAIWPSARAGSNRRCTNTMHRVYGDLCQAVSIPVLHIADGTARQLKAAQVTTVGLLGTRYTMEQDLPGTLRM